MVIQISTKFKQTIQAKGKVIGKYLKMRYKYWKS